MSVTTKITFNDSPSGQGDAPQVTGRISNMVITNNTGESIAYSTDSGASFTTLANGSSATLGAGDPSSFRFRRVNSGGYPLAVDAVITMSTPMSDGWFDTNADGSTSLLGPSGILLTGILRMGAVPSGIAPSGSVGANGALTLDTALPVTYSDGIWLYLPAGAAYAGSSAGMYWVVMSSGTAGTIYDTIGTGFLNNQIGAAVPISAAGPGIYAGTTAEITLTTFSLPGNLMGPNGYLLVRARGAHPNNANNKGYRRSIAGVSTGLANFSTTNTAPLLWELINRGKATSNLFGAPQNAYTANTALNIPSAIDTTVDNDVTLTGQLAVATDFLIYDMVVVEVISTGAQS